MRYMMLMIPAGYEKADPGTMPDDPKAVEAMMRFNQDMQEAGVLVAAEGLHPPSAGTRVSFATGEPVATDGPFVEAKEVVGGFWIVEVASHEEAVEWARRCPGQPNETIEIRRIMEMDDFSGEIRDVVEEYEDMRQRREG